MRAVEALEILTGPEYGYAQGTAVKLLDAAVLSEDGTHTTGRVSISFGTAAGYSVTGNRQDVRSVWFKSREASA